MKAIKRSTLLELVRHTRNFAITGNCHFLDARIATAKELSKQAYGEECAWLAFVEFAESTCGVFALYPECTDEDFCELFRALKFEVLDE